MAHDTVTKIISRAGGEISATGLISGNRGRPAFIPPTRFFGACPSDAATRVLAGNARFDVGYRLLIAVARTSHH